MTRQFGRVFGFFGALVAIVPLGCAISGCAKEEKDDPNYTKNADFKKRIAKPKTGE